jgi:hypothetical protein
MAQYPQGIFQSLQYLLKKVKILALQKQPTYDVIIPANTIYTLVGRGIYTITSIGGSSSIKLPDPSFCKGQTICILVPISVGVVSISGTGYIAFGGLQASLSAGGGYTLASNGTTWYAVGSAA